MSTSAKIIVAIVVIALAALGIYKYMNGKKSQSAPAKQKPNLPEPGKSIVDNGNVVTLDNMGTSLSIKPLSSMDVRLS